MDEYSPGIRRVCVAVDVDDRDENSVTATGGRVSALVADMCDSAGIGELPVYRQPAGSGEVILLPVGIDEPRVVTLIVTWLARSLSEANTGRDGPRVRLRIAMHEGITKLVAGVFEGPAVRHVRRLVKAGPLRAALASQPGANVAVLLSDRIHADLGGFDECLPPEEFTEVEVGDSSARAEIGWLLVPE